MAAGVSSGIGVISTIAGISAQNKAAKTQRQQAEVTKYGQEVQYQTQKMALEQQKEFARQQNVIQAMQYEASDAQAKMLLKQQDIEGLMSNAQAVFANNQQLQNAEAQSLEATNAANRNEFGVKEGARQRLGQAADASSQSNTQVSQQLQSVSKAVQDGDMNRAAMLAMQAQSGQEDTRTSGFLSSDTRDLMSAIQQKVAAGRFTEDDLQQLQYNKELTGQLEALGLNGVANDRATNANALDYAQKTGRMNDSNLGYQQQQNALGSKMAGDALTGATAIRNQGTNIEQQFSQLGFQSQGNNLSAASSSQISASQAQIAASRPNGLLSALAIGGSLFNAAAPYVMRPWQPPTAKVKDTRYSGFPNSLDNIG